MVEIFATQFMHSFVRSFILCFISFNIFHPTYICCSDRFFLSSYYMDWILIILWIKKWATDRPTHTERRRFNENVHSIRILLVVFVRLSFSFSFLCWGVSWHTAIVWALPFGCRFNDRGRTERLHESSKWAYETIHFYTHWMLNII